MRMFYFSLLIHLFFIAPINGQTQYIAPSANASNAMLIVDQTTILVDTIRDETKSVFVDFWFTNTGTEPLLIYNAVTSTGAVTAEFPKAPIKPQERNKIRVAFNPRHKVGAQNKTIMVYSNSRNGDVALRLLAYVLPQNKTTQEDTSARLSFAYKTIRLGKIAANSKQEVSFPFLNSGKTAFQITRVTASSSMYCPTYPVEMIVPGKREEIRIQFHTAGKIGRQQRVISVFTSFQEEPFLLRLEYEIIPVVPMKNTDSLGPCITFMHTLIDLDSISQNTNTTVSYRFTNTGKEPLIISNAQSSCGCLVASWPKDPIMPGGSGEIKVHFSLAGKSGIQDKSVQVYSNGSDPLIVLHLKCFVILENKRPK
jgi:hypothetical protein